MGAALAGWPGDVVLHAGPRSPSSRAGSHARASAWIPASKGDWVRSVELGKAVERVRRAGRPRERPGLKTGKFSSYELGVGVSVPGPAITGSDTRRSLAAAGGVRNS